MTHYDVVVLGAGPGGYVAAIRAAQRVLSALKEDGDTARIEAELATFQEREDAVGTNRWRALEERYMQVDG